MNGAPLKADAAWCDSVDNNLPPAMAVDGISDRADNGWNGRGDLHRNRTLMLALASPAPAGAQVSVKLACMGGKAQIPKALSAAFLAEEGLADGLRQVVQAQTLAVKNAKFEAWDTGRCPRIVLLDSDRPHGGRRQRPAPENRGGIAGNRPPPRSRAREAR